ncbi:MAG: hypothetical protein Kow0097_08810 [Candidatus Bipolaricaulota bacterium]
MRRDSFLVSLVLIAAGVILLLNNLGHLPWSVWGTLARLWPVLLIALGLDILFGRSALRWALSAAIAVLVLIAVALALFGPASARSAEAVRVPIGDATRAEVTLTATVGQVTVRASADPDLLVRGEVVAPWPDRGRWESKRREDTEEFSLTLEREHGFPSAWWPERTQATVELAPAIPLALRAMLGEGAAALDLSGLDLTTLAVQGGAGGGDAPPAGTVHRLRRQRDRGDHGAYSQRARGTDPRRGGVGTGGCAGRLGTRRRAHHLP